MPEIQLIPQAPNSFGEGLAQSLGAGQSMMQMYAIKKQLESQDLQNKIASEHLKQTQDMAPLQKALMEADVAHTYADIDQMKSGTSLRQQNFDFSKATDTEKLSLARRMTDAQIGQITESVADSRQGRELRAKLQPIMEAQAVAQLNETQARIQAMQQDTSYKFTLASQHQQELDLQAKNSEEDKALQTWIAYQHMDPKSRAAAQAGPLGRYVQGFPTDQQGLQEFVAQKTREMYEKNPQMFAKVIGAYAAQMAMPGDDKNKAEMFEQMQAIFDKTMTKKQSLRQQMENAAGAMLGGSKMPGTPILGKGQTPDGPAADGLENNPVDQKISGFDVSRLDNVFDSENQVSEPTTLQIPSRDGNIREVKNPKAGQRKRPALQEDLALNAGIHSTDRLNQYIGMTSGVKADDTEQTIMRGVIDQAAASKNPRAILVQFGTTKYAQALSAMQQKRLEQIVLKMETDLARDK